MGVDVDDLCPIRRLHADAVVSGVLGRVLRRTALRHERRLAGHGEGADSAGASATGSARTILTCTPSSGRALLDADIYRPSHRVCRGGRARPSPDAETAAVEVSVRRARLEPVRGDLPAPVVSHHASGEPVARASRPGSRRSRGVRCRAIATRATIVELGCGSGEKLMVLAEALQDRGGSARVHLIDISSQALEQTEQRLTRFRHISVVGHQSTYEEGLRRAAAARDRRQPGARVAPRIPTSATSIRRLPMRSCGASARVLEPGDLLLLGADLVKPEDRAAACLRRSARRDRRVQQEPAGSHQPRAGGQFRSR